MVDGFREGNGVEVASKDEDYIPSASEMSSDEDNLFEVEVENGSSDDCGKCKAIRFDDSANNGDHEDHFEGEIGPC